MACKHIFIITTWCTIGATAGNATTGNRELTPRKSGAIQQHIGSLSAAGSHATDTSSQKAS